MKAINIQRVSKHYNHKGSKTPALDGIDLTINQGDFFALLGPNGAGKSTLINIISGLIKPDTGHVEVLGQKIPANHLIGLMPQEFNFHVFETVEDIVKNYAGFFGIDRSKAAKHTEHALKLVDLWQKRKSQAITLSGGMKRRLMIARAIVHQPKIIILDEPTAGVDIEIRNSMWELFQKMNEQGTTLILTTHYLEEAEALCKNVAIINHGKIIVNNSMQKVLQMLEKEIFLIEVSSAKNLPNLDEFEMKIISDQCIEVIIHRGTNKSINNLLIKLKDAEIEIQAIQNKSNRLEAFFLSKTQPK